MGIFLIGFIIAQGPGNGQGSGQGLPPDNPSNNSSQNQNEANLQNQQEIKAGNYTGENGQQIMVQKQSNNQMRIKVNKVSVNCNLNLTQKQIQNKTKLETKLSNGRNAEIKVMPDVASEKALKRLRLKNCVEEQGCSLELKEVGQGEQTKLAYELKTQRQAKVFGLFKTKMQVQAQVNAETGEIIQTKKPWWSFLASEPAEE